MMPKDLADLINQPLDGWKIFQWYEVHQRVRDGWNGYKKKLLGIFRHAATANQIKRSRKSVTIKPLLVFHNGQLTFNLSTGKLIQQTAEWIKADQQSSALEEVRQRALAKLTLEERKALNIK